MPKVWNLGSEPMVDGDISISPGCGRFVDANGLRRLGGKYAAHSYHVGPILPPWWVAKHSPKPPVKRLEIKDVVTVTDKVDVAPIEPEPPTRDELEGAFKAQLKSWADMYGVPLEGNPTKTQILEILEQHFYPVDDDDGD
jgi:hypothetical protein